jgi:hypothetical protein
MERGERTASRRSPTHLLIIVCRYCGGVVGAVVSGGVVVSGRVVVELFGSLHTGFCAFD